MNPATDKPQLLPVENRRREAVLLACLVALYVIFRLPFALKQLAGQDESYFSVPGLLIARGEVPSIPYYPARNPEAYFYRADEILLEMPPALFYLQAPFFLVMPPGVAAARMPSLLAGAIAIVLVYQIGRRAFGSLAGLYAAGCYAASRVLFFAATFARPDELCAAFGLGAILLTWDALELNSRKRLVLAGIALGLGLLSHPFAITYCLLCGIWVLAAQGTGVERVIRATILTATTLLVFALWLPLILHDPDIFRHQFFNTMNLTGPGLLTRLLWPWPFVPHQVRLLWDQAGPWQASAMFAGLVGSTAVALISPKSSMTRFVAVTWGALYLLTACQGQHPTKGYWAFTGALLMVNLGFLAYAAVVVSWVLSLKARVCECAVALSLIAVFLPESGVRMWWRHVRTDPEARYDGPAFTRRMLAELPLEGRFVVEPAFVLDVWQSGRSAIVREDEQVYLIDRYDYDWLLVSRDGLEKSIPEQLNGRLVQSFGVKDDPFACYAELYAPRDSQPPAEPRQP